ncbi:excalibur calcium-binding domain-containing protein [Streptomyces sp. SJL17-4]|uniref:excalibur calcium-binding domain-containing protein n=1 Tax=Streptomyces sp. SJL17-4 TaxID=2967224 RepID=UPI0030D556C7
MGKNGGESCADGCVGVILLLVIGAVAFVACDDDSGALNADSPATAATQLAEPRKWQLRDIGLDDETTLWWDTEKSETLRLLTYAQAEDANSAALDDLDDDEGLTAKDVELKLLSMPKHGTAKLNKADGTVVYTPRAGFEGQDEFRFSVQLRGRPRVVEGTQTIAVEESPGGRYGREHSAVVPSEPFANCAAARAGGATPVHEGDPGYGPHLDGDSDGIGCEWG